MSNSDLANDALSGGEGVVRDGTGGRGVLLARVSAVANGRSAQGPRRRMLGVQKTPNFRCAHTLVSSGLTYAQTLERVARIDFVSESDGEDDEDGETHAAHANGGGTEDRREGGKSVGSVLTRFMHRIGNAVASICRAPVNQKL